MDSGNTTAVTNVRVFDGAKLTDPTTVYISDGRIVSHSEGVTEIDGEGYTLLPGLIDAHCHVFEHDELVQLAKAGVTTALDMGSFPVEKIHSFRNQKGLTDYCSAGIGLTAPGTYHSKLAGMPTAAQVMTIEGARQFVRDRVDEGMDYIKLIVDSPGPSQEVLNAACDEVRKVGKLSIAHAPSFKAVEMAQAAGCDFVTHIMIDRPAINAGVQKMIEEGRGCIPTLTIMEVVNKLGIPGNDYKNCEESVRIMHQAGVTILAGTDANAVPGSPAHVK
jgi:imidazolonepropionase-like amidohydrolase